MESNILNKHTGSYYYDGNEKETYTLFKNNGKVAGELFLNEDDAIELVTAVNNYDSLNEEVMQLRDSNKELREIRNDLGKLNSIYKSNYDSLLEALKECQSYMPALASHQDDQNKFNEIMAVNDKAKETIKKAQQ